MFYCRFLAVNIIYPTFLLSLVEIRALIYVAEIVLIAFYGRLKQHVAGMMIVIGTSPSPALLSHLRGRRDAHALRTPVQVLLEIGKVVVPRPDVGGFGGRGCLWPALSTLQKA
jgi:hypothetical protein